MVKGIKIKKKIISISILGLIFVFSCLSSTDSTIFSFNGADVSNTLISGYTTHEPIWIDSSDDFSTYGFSGTGDPGTPYLIANYSITNGVDYSIKIINVDDYFIIENCYIEGSLHGITLYNIGTGRTIIRNNTCSDHTFGIYLHSSAQSQILNNTVSDTKWAINSEYCSESVIHNNTCTNGYVGISSSFSSQINISNNSLKDNYVGVDLFHIYATVINNTLINNGFNINFYFSSDYPFLTFTDNSINGLPIAIIYNEADETIDASLYGQIIVVNSSRITITDLSISPATIYGIHFFYSDSCIVTDIASLDIYAYYSPDLEISSSTFINDFNALDEPNKYGTAIYTRYSNNALIQDNTCENYGNGVSSFRSNNSDILRNTCDDNDIGIAIYSQNCLLEDNNLNLNVVGITIMGSQTLEVTGISVISNTVTSSLGYGIEFYGNTTNNVIHHNVFQDNYPGGTSQAYDVGINNIWYDTSTNKGNFWSDWSGSGSYPIDGTAGSEDPYPLSSISEFSLKTAILFVILVSCIAIVPLIKKRK